MRVTEGLYTDCIALSKDLLGLLSGYVSIIQGLGPTATRENQVENRMENVMETAIVLGGGTSHEHL